MIALHEANLADMPDHGVLNDPWTYDVVEARYVAGRRPFGTLDLVLEKDGQRLVLRFTDAHDLAIDPGFPYCYMGLELLDVSSIGWERTRIRVQGSEDAPGIRFWAGDVQRIDG
ncbi:hypothetical protein ASD53_15445 [Lysobacter sp. Root559]|nr:MULTISPECIES: hypothetical protein [unclassified Lysobacter]KQZ55657.1 hypothetical protein ASD53_15445 [Lysobacter sp. Root559]KRC31597.1 hypothetical protein ASE10_17930 [Lysobacter sp. Root76]KRD65504.1 hypothetical protein ASE45_19125 [Lysobacter sp. Root96]